MLWSSHLAFSCLTNDVGEFRVKGLGFIGFVGLVGIIGFIGFRVQGGYWPPAIQLIFGDNWVHHVACRLFPVTVHVGFRKGPRTQMIGFYGPKYH